MSHIGSAHSLLRWEISSAAVVVEDFCSLLTPHPLLEALGLSPMDSGAMTALALVLELDRCSTKILDVEVIFLNYTVLFCYSTHSMEIHHPLIDYNRRRCYIFREVSLASH